MYSWHKANTEFHSARNPIAGKPLHGKATRLYQRELTEQEQIEQDAVGYKYKYVIRQHNTDVVTIYPYHYELNSGGFRTYSTKERINEYSSAYVWQKNGQWYLREPRDRSIWGEDIYLFFDGIKVDENGQILNKQPLSEDNEEIKIKKQLDKLISKYKKGFKQLIKDGELEDPSGGDCWYCCMFEASMGSDFNPDHVISHLIEQYYVPSLLFNAIKEKGYREPAFIWQRMRDSGDGWPIDTVLGSYFRKRSQSIIEYVKEEGWPELESE